MFTSDQKRMIMAAVIKAIDDLPSHPRCDDCVHRRCPQQMKKLGDEDARKICGLAPMLEVPDEVRANGCPRFEHDDIPF